MKKNPDKTLKLYEIEKTSNTTIKFNAKSRDRIAAWLNIPEIGPELAGLKLIQVLLQQ